MKYLYWLIPIAFLLLILLTMLFLHFQKKRIVKKVRSMTTKEKTELINHLIEPVGYIYEPTQDIFATRLKAPQKHSATQPFTISRLHSSIWFLIMKPYTLTMMREPGLSKYGRANMESTLVVNWVFTMPILLYLLTIIRTHFSMLWMKRICWIFP